MKARRPFIAGNWKMNTNRESAQQLATALVESIGNESDVDVAICPPSVYLLLLHDILAASRIALGAQNVYFETSGAFTGELAAEMLADVGCKYVIIGHSERRHILGEDDESINRKLRSALETSLHPILCVGETGPQREQGQTHDIVAGQVRAGLMGVPFEQLRDVTIAYEPVWAIGTGKVASPEQAEEVHAFIRDRLTQMYGADLAQSTRIQYGGSVTAANAAGLLAKPNVDGALVGGASLKAEDFAQIVRSAHQLASAG